MSGSIRDVPRRRRCLRPSIASVLVLALIVAAAGFATAQPSSIRVKKGDRFDFAVRSEVEVTEILGDSERTIRAAAEGPARLTVERLRRGEIRWTCETPAVRMQDSMPFGDSGHVRSMRVSTDSRGKLRSGRATNATGLAPLVESVHRGILLLWFPPRVFRNMRPGAVWTESRNEPVVVQSLGVEASARYEVRYVFDGIVDTLGMKAIRLRWTAPTVSVRGTRRVDGVAVTLQGDGDHSGTAYFSTVDGLLLAGVVESSLDLRTPSGDGGAAMPTMWRMRSASVRR